MSAPAGYSDEAEVDAWVARIEPLPGVRVHAFGSSVEHRLLRAIEISRSGGSDRPMVMAIANIHGCEVISSELAMAVVDALVAASPSPAASALLEAADVVVVPVVNPDGRSRALASLDRRWPIRPAPRRNANGVDLNRNWPWAPGVQDHWSPLSGTSRIRSPWYRGPRPLSEPETSALAKLIDRRPPRVLLNLHSTGQIVTYPWSGRPDPTPDRHRFEQVAAAFTGAQPTWTYRAKQSNSWYPIAGSSNDWLYATHQTLALTVETGVPGAAVRSHPRRAGSFFWYANPDDPDAHIANDLAACLAAFQAGLETQTAP